MANDLNFYIAIMEAVDGSKPGQMNPFLTIGDRERLIEKFEQYGYIITKKPK